MVNSGQTYILSNKKAGTVCDLSGQDQTSITGWANKGSDNQKWKVQDTGNGWTFQSVYNQKYLDTAAPNNSPPTNGTKVVAVETGEPRAWDIRTDQNDGNACRIFVPGTNLNVDLSQHGNRNEGTPVTLWDKTGGENQVWNFEQV